MNNFPCSDIIQLQLLISVDDNLAQWPGIQLLNLTSSLLVYRELLHV